MNKEDVCRTVVALLNRHSEELKNAEGMLSMRREQYARACAMTHEQWAGSDDRKASGGQSLKWRKNWLASSIANYQRLELENLVIIAALEVAAIDGSDGGKP